MIVGVNKIVIQVDDQDRALRFWTERVGFEVVKDATMGDERWVEVRPPGHETMFVLSPREYPAPAVRDGIPNVSYFFEADDLTATYEQLSSRGVTFVQTPVEYPWGWWSMFVDDEGNRFALTPVSAT